LIKFGDITPEESFFIYLWLYALPATGEWDLLNLSPGRATKETTGKNVSIDCRFVGPHFSIKCGVNHPKREVIPFLLFHPQDM
jgi:hypothetical protein